MDVLEPIEEALASLPAEQRAEAGGPVLVAQVLDALQLDEDELNAASRRGLLLAAAEGDPSAGAGQGSRAVLETASDLAAAGYGAPLAAALGDLERAAGDDLPCVRDAAAALRDDPRLALEALAVVVLHRAME